MNVQLPDGSVIADVPDGTSKLDLIKKLKTNDNPNWEKMAADYTRQFSPVDKNNPITEALGEPGLHAASGLYHAVKGGYAGLADLAEGKGGHQAKKDIESEEAKAYQPTSKVGRAASKIAGYPGAIQERAANFLGNKAQDVAARLGASPEVAGGVNAAVYTAGEFAGPGALLKRKAHGKEVGGVGFPDVQETAARLAPKDPGITAEITKLARSRGYVLKPSEAGGIGGKVAEGLAGSPKLSAEMSIKNQKVTNRLIAEEHQLPEGTRITRGNLAIAKKPYNAVYKEVSGLGDIKSSPEYIKKVQDAGRTPGTSFQGGGADPEITRLKEKYADPAFNSKDAVLHVRQLRADAVKNLKAPNAPKQNELGVVQRQIADAIDSELERKAVEAGKPDLVKRLQGARKELAKIHTTEAALVGNSGDVSAQKLAQLQSKGVPLDGNQKIIADVATEFGEVTRTGTKVKNKTPFSVLEGAVGIVGAGVHHPGLAAGIVARPATRQFLMSDMYQNRLAPGPKKPSTLAEIEDTK